MLKLIPPNPDARGTEWAALQFADVLPVEPSDPVTTLNPARVATSLRDKATALLHLQAAQTLLRPSTGMPAAERALDDADTALRGLIAQVTLAVGVLHAGAVR